MPPAIAEPPAPAPAPTPAAAAPPAAVPPVVNPPAPAVPPAGAPAATSLLGDAPGQTPKPGETPGEAPKFKDFNLPEGMTKDDAMLAKAIPLFSEAKLSQETAQKFVDLQAQHSKTVADSIIADAEKQRTTQLAAWEAETKKTLGTEWQKELGFAGKVLDAFGGPERGKELRSLLTLSGLGNHPLMAQFLVSLGKAMSEGQPGAGARVNIEDPETTKKRAMFPTMYNEDGSRK